MKTVLIPQENMKDLTEIKEDALKGLEIVPVKHIEEVLARALVRQPTPLTDDAEATLMPPKMSSAPNTPAAQPSAEFDADQLSQQCEKNERRRAKFAAACYNPLSFEFDARSFKVRWILSSVGRATPLHGVGRGFESLRIHHQSSFGL